MPPPGPHPDEAFSPGDHAQPSWTDDDYLIPVYPKKVKLKLVRRMRLGGNMRKATLN